MYFPHDCFWKVLNRNEATASVLKDYFNAFDTIDYEALLRNLFCLNFDDGSVKSILNRLSNRNVQLCADMYKSMTNCPFYFFWVLHNEEFWAQHLSSLCTLMNK